MATAVAGASNCSVDDLAMLAMLHRQPVGPPPPAPPTMKPNNVGNLCPFRCGIDELTELGYCRHLIGFTTNAKTLEPIKPRMRQLFDVYTGKPMRDEATGKPILEPDGTFYVDGRPESLRPVLKTDILKFEGQDGRPAISARVYRGGEDDPLPTKQKTLADMDLDELRAAVELLLKRRDAQRGETLQELARE